MLFLTFAFAFLVNLGFIHARAGDSCRTPNGQQAICRPINQCAVLYDAVLTNDPTQIQFLRESFCGYGQTALVCCGSDANFVQVRTTGRSSLLPDRTTCGIQAVSKILGGEATALEEFPWMAVLQYRSGRGGALKSSCGGALISSRYVLTAAHCVTGEIQRVIGNLANVRLGEYNTDTNPDCVRSQGFESCNDPHINVGVEEAIAHPGYHSTKRTNDIALVRLNRDVSFTEYIKPICLPEPEEVAAVGTSLIVSGWGQTETTKSSKLKLKVDVPVVSSQTCASKFSTYGITIESSQLCAGGVKNKDSCKGDSGGPLMATAKNDSSQWYAEGVVSYGAACGEENWPAVYTKVSSYLPWIWSNIK